MRQQPHLTVSFLYMYSNTYDTSRSASVIIIIPMGTLITYMMIRATRRRPILELDLASQACSNLRRAKSPGTSSNRTTSSLGCVDMVSIHKLSSNSTLSGRLNRNRWCGYFARWGKISYTIRSLPTMNALWHWITTSTAGTHIFASGYFPHLMFRLIPFLYACVFQKGRTIVRQVRSATFHGERCNLRQIKCQVFAPIDERGLLGGKSRGFSHDCNLSTSSTQVRQTAIIGWSATLSGG